MKEKLEIISENFLIKKEEKENHYINLNFSKY